MGRAWWYTPPLSITKKFIFYVRGLATPTPLPQGAAQAPGTVSNGFGYAFIMQNWIRERGILS